MLSKSIRPLPSVKTDEEGNVHDAFTDPELRYRMRYVDLVVNPESSKTFEARSRVIQAMRDAFTEQGMAGSGHPGATGHSRWCGGTPVHDPPQCP